MVCHIITGGAQFTSLWRHKDAATFAQYFQELKHFIKLNRNNLNIVILEYQKETYTSCDGAVVNTFVAHQTNGHSTKLKCGLTQCNNNNMLQISILTEEYRNFE